MAKEDLEDEACPATEYWPHTRDCNQIEGFDSYAQYVCPSFVLCIEYSSYIL